MTSRIVIALTLSSLVVFPTTPAPAHRPIAGENKSTSALFSTGFPHADLQTGPQQLPLVTLTVSFLGSTQASTFPATDLSVGTEQRGLILLGCTLLLFGFFWLKRRRRAPHSVDSQTPTTMPAAPVSRPEPDPIWVEVQLTHEPNPETCDEAQIAV